jgi:hypothetical protein
MAAIQEVSPTNIRQAFLIFLIPVTVFPLIYIFVEELWQV